MNLLDVFRKHGIFQRARAGRRAALLPVVIAAGGNFQMKTEGQEKWSVFIASIRS
jgi:hypothetical protein